jgi:hypothetical protein
MRLWECTQTNQPHHERSATPEHKFSFLPLCVTFIKRVLEQGNNREKHQ